MKLRNIFAVLAATLTLAVGCQEELDAPISDVKVSSSYVGIPGEGGSAAITVEASADWSLEIPETATWLTADPMSGVAGTTEVTFSAAEPADGTYTATVKLVCGEKALTINVIQLGEKTETPISTCQEVNDGAESVNYRVKGTVTKITETATYGNWYINDGTIDDPGLYIYGTKYNGETKQAALIKLGIEVGDIVTIEGPKTVYNGTVELVDVDVIDIEKSLMKLDSIKIAAPAPDAEDALAIEGGNAVAYLTNKGDGCSVEIPEDAQAWLSVTGINVSGTATEVTLSATANEGGDRSTTITFKTSNSGKDYTAQGTLTQKGAILELSIADFNAKDETKGTYYRLSGIISVVDNAEKGRFHIKDWSGETYVYNMADFAAKELKAGDIVTLIGQRDVYKETVEVINASFEKTISVIPATIAEFNAAEKSEDIYYMVSGTLKEIVKAQYGNVYITDGENDLYVYGVYPGYGATGDARKDFLATAGIEVGDKLTMIGYKDVYNETIELCGGIYFSHEKGVSVPTFNVTPATVSADADATTATIKVEGNVAWTATASEGATVDPASGEGAADITVTFAANEATDAKEYTVTVATEAEVETKSFEVVINQKGTVVPPKTLPYEESFKDGFGELEVNNVSVPEGKSVWSTGSYNGVSYAKASGYNLGDGVEAWLISPSIDLTSETAAYLSFSHCYKFGVTTEMTLWVKEEGGEWAEVAIPDYGAGNYAWADVCIDFSSYLGKTIQFAFKYTSDSTNASTWEIASLSMANAQPLAENTITATASLEIVQGETAQIEASNTAGLEMSYTSSDAGVATVDASGLVSAVAPGTAKITIATAETAEYKAASAVCNVTVTEAGVKMLIIDGSKLSDTATTAESEYDYDGVTIAMSDGAKAIASTGENKFTSSAILIGKADKYIFNKTAIPGKITKFEIYSNKGASSKVSVGVCFSDKAIASYDAANAYTVTLSTVDSVYDCSEKLSGNDSYFWYQITNAYNSQVEFRITYVESDDVEGSGNIGIDDWQTEGSGDVNVDDWDVESYGSGNINDWVVD